jgi:hypothetical protein
LIVLFGGDSFNCYDDGELVKFLYLHRNISVVRVDPT